MWFSGISIFEYLSSNGLIFVPSFCYIHLLFLIYCYYERRAELDIAYTAYNGVGFCFKSRKLGFWNFFFVLNFFFKAMIRLWRKQWFSQFVFCLHWIDYCNYFIDSDFLLHYFFLLLNLLSSASPFTLFVFKNKNISACFILFSTYLLSEGAVFSKGQGF